MGPLQFMQGLPGTTHQRLPAGLREIGVGLKLLSQLRQQLLLMGGQGPGCLPQAAAEEGLKGLTPPLQVAEATIGLQLQPLLEGPQPGWKAQD